MVESQSNIPTLTDITHHGDKEMLNHFDAHKFDDKAEETEATLTVENATVSENTHELKNTELNDIPSIQIEDKDSSDIESEDFSEAMQSIATKTSTIEVEGDALREKIDQAITDALPGIEAHLKKSLYTKFGV